MNYKNIIIEELTKVDESWEAYRKERDRIDKQIARLERKRDRLNPLSMNTALSTIGNRISKKPNQVYGPFGLGSERSLYIMKGDDMNICGDNTVHKSLTFRGFGSSATIVLRDEPSQSNFPANSIGDVNGFNRKTALVETLSDRRIKKLMSRND